MHNDTLKAILSTSVAIYTLVGSDAALAQTKKFDVPAQSAVTGIPELAAQADIQILVSESAVRGKRTKAVKGQLAIDQAIARLLSGTGLKVASSDGRTYTLSSGKTVGNGNSDAAGRGAVTGVVRDNATGAALKGARVEIAGSGSTTSSDGLGRFRFSDVPAGEVTVRVSYLGYPATSATFTVEAGRSAKTEIILGGGGDGSVREIVVTAYKSARAQALNQERTADNSTTIISGDLLGNFAGATISDALRRAPGVAFEQDINNPTGDGTNIIVRGVTPEYNRIKLNGIDLPEGLVMTSSGRAPSLGTILADSIAQITINKTLLPSQDSSGAGGMVEIETKSPLDRPRRFVSASIEGTKRGKGFGQDFLVTGTLSARFGANDDFGISVSAQYRKQDVTTQGYDINGFLPGLYLPLNERGVAVREFDMDPRLPFPLEGGSSELYISGVGNRVSRVEAETLGITATAEWQVSPSTNLRFDYVRSQQVGDTFNQDMTLLDFPFYNIEPVAELGGQLRYVLSNRLRWAPLTYNASYTEGSKNTSDTFSLRSSSKFGKLDVDIKAGYAIGSSRVPHAYSVSLGGAFQLLPLSAYLSEAVDATGSARLFAPRSGTAYPLPLLSQSGYEYMFSGQNLPFQQAVDSVNSRSKNRALTGELTTRYNFEAKNWKYIEVGGFYKQSDFSSRYGGSSTYSGFVDGGYSSAAQAGLDQFYDIEFSRVAGSPNAMKFIETSAYMNLFNNLDDLVSRNVAALSTNPGSTLENQSYTKEADLAGYVMTRVDSGKLELIGGVRFDRLRVQSGVPNAITLFDENNQFDQAVYDRSLVVVDQVATQTSFLPRFLLNYRQSENLIFRAGYFTSVSRPSLRDLSQSQYITLMLSETNGPGRDQAQLDIFRGNPDLKPARTANFDFSVEHYEKNVGAIKIGLFLKRFSNLLESNNSQQVNDLSGINLPDDPVFSPENLPSNLFVSIQMPVNNPDTASVYGVETSIERQFDFLPGALSGLGVYANYTYTKSSKNQPGSWYKPTYDENGNIDGSEQEFYVLRNVPFDGSPQHSATAGLTYSKYGVDARLYYTIQSRRSLGSGARFRLDPYHEATDTLDLRAEYRFKVAGGDFRLSVEGQDLLRGSQDSRFQRTIGGVGKTTKYYTSGQYLGGRTIVVGLGASF